MQRANFFRLSAALATLFAAIGAVNAACPPNSLVGSRDSVWGGCICPSGFNGTASNGTCTPSNIANVCPGGQLPSTSSIKSSLAGIGLTTINMTGTDTLVPLTIQMPMMGGRTYDTVGVTGPRFDEVQTGCTAAEVFSNFTSIDPSAGCIENWNITAEFDKLRVCGFQVSAANDLTSGYQLFDGNIRVKFNEPVTLGEGIYAQNTSRIVYVDYPVRISFDTNYQIAMTVRDVTVYSKHKVDFAMTGQNIPKDPSPATKPVTATITYQVQYPYAIIQWGAVSTAAAITATVSPMTQAKICAKGSDYIVSDNVTIATCKKSDNSFTFNTGAANTKALCQFDNYQYLLPFSVQCATGIAPPDCPIAAPDSTGTVTFSITTENFCTALAETDSIDGVITITAFKAYSILDFETQQNAWRYGDDLFMRMDFIGLPLQTCHLTKLERVYSNTTITAVNETEWVEVGSPGVVSPSDPTLTTSIQLAGFADSGVISTTNLAPASGIARGNLGLNADGNKYLFKFKLNEQFLGQNSEPLRGADSFLKLRATIDVTYDRPVTGRRRRRQAAGGVSGGKGVKQSDPQSIAAAAPQVGDDVAAAMPNSAASVRISTTVAALALSLVAVVALW